MIEAIIVMDNNDDDNNIMIPIYTPGTKDKRQNREEAIVMR